MIATIKAILTALGTLSGILGLVPSITTLIEQVESTTATGAQKKAAVLSLVSAALTTVDSACKIDLPIDTIITCAGSLIDAIVNFKNLVGAFEHSNATTGATTTAA